MSRSEEITVSRTYTPAPDECARALELLLKTTVSKKGGPATALKDDVKESRNGYVAKTIIPE
jgi:hypothetical protein